MGEGKSSMRAKWVSKLMKLRWSAVILGMLNMVVLVLGMILIKKMHDKQCSKRDIIPIIGIWVVGFVRIIAMVRTALAQRATALLVVSQTPISDALIRHQKRVSPLFLKSDHFHIICTFHLYYYSTIIPSSFHRWDTRDGFGGLVPLCLLLSCN